MLPTRAEYHSSADTFPAIPASQPLRAFLYFVFHHSRLFGWAPPLCLAIAKWPKRVSGFLVFYVTVHRQRWWQRGVHQVLGFGASYRSKVITPYKSHYNPEQRYLLCTHPHGILVDGFHNWVAKNINCCESRKAGDVGTGHPTMVRGVAGCFAPVIQHIPVHSEMYRDMCSGASAREVASWWEKRMPDGTGIDPLIAPGGFSECCFSDAGNKHIEYHYLKGRMGFVKIAIENGVDIAPLYAFNITNMYRNIPFLRGLRARLSQKIFIGLSWPLGKYSTFMPLTDETTSVWFPPFPASQYNIDQLEEAHAAYLEHLEKYFDIHKAEFGQADAKIEFVGKDFVDNDRLAIALRHAGLLRSRL
eukprot:gnl/MRDRNA2_/MRDRNA2_170220_c0_seq1.p1 gnl/MRDRNA2_/MRDRNA2_170220_c0~~gnl/MRDRNA2_/MRDRNA2_170220_c0_seq1.p1  ORF type:complete len:360 (-),score=34.97 gnl/MRDRNA2_/MRDRNA2_170220_c0_seq1:120-1199(-)